MQRNQRSGTRFKQTVKSCGSCRDRSVGNGQTSTMTSKPDYTQAYVWVWLPGSTAPVVAGLLTPSGTDLQFNYGRSYLARTDAVPLYVPELPLESGPLPLLNGLSLP